MSSAHSLPNLAHFRPKVGLVFLTNLAQFGQFLAQLYNYRFQQPSLATI
jgi:hypothetical protein